MPPLAVATVVAKPLLPLARVLAQSFRRHHPDLPFFAVLADEVDGYFEPATEPFRLLRLDELGIPRLHRVRFHYSQQELTYAVTPSVLRHLLDAGFAGAVFLKQESLVVGDLTPALDMLDRRSIVLTPHLLRPLAGEDAGARELGILQSGVYNVGFLGVAATPVARSFLAWWEDRMFQHCRWDIPHGLHLEQRWLDLVPAYFEDFEIVHDPGLNVGHWNLPDRQLRAGAGGLTVDGHPCRFVRFSGFDPNQPHAVTRYSPRLDLDNVGAAADLFRHYAALLEAAGYRETLAWPYAYARFDNGVAVTGEMRAYYIELGDAVERFGDPLVTTRPGSFLPAFYRWRRRQRLSRLPRRLARRAAAIATRVMAAARRALSRRPPRLTSR